MKFVKCETGELSGCVECAVVLIEGAMLRTGRARCIEQSLPHTIVELQSRDFTKSSETNHGNLLGNQNHKHHFAYHIWPGL